MVSSTWLASALGWVEEEEILKPENVEAGDLIIGVPRQVRIAMDSR